MIVVVDIRGGFTIPPFHGGLGKCWGTFGSGWKTITWIYSFNTCNKQGRFYISVNVFIDKKKKPLNGNTINVWSKLQ